MFCKVCLSFCIISYLEVELSLVHGSQTFSQQDEHLVLSDFYRRRNNVVKTILGTFIGTASLTFVCHSLDILR